VLVLVLGGARSGKSAFAETLATRLGGPVTYVATTSVDPGDEDMEARIVAHRDRRPAAWVTVEAGGDLVGALHSSPDGTLLVDALGPWVAASTKPSPPWPPMSGWSSPGGRCRSRRPSRPEHVTT
jgi:adenosyl cobinamide kinase/adenosyl cobinamide phosphate guanylyltransferase